MLLFGFVLRIYGFVLKMKQDEKDVYVKRNFIAVFHGVTNIRISN